MEGRVLIDEKVGIGTDNPTALIHAQNNSVSDTKIIIESTGTNSYPSLRLKNDVRTYDLGIDGATDSFRVYDVTGSAERLRIESDGDLLPGANGTQNIGSNSKKWKDIYLSGDINLSGDVEIDQLLVTGISTFKNKVHLLDNDILHFGGAEGDDGDLQIYHDGGTMFY